MIVKYTPKELELLARLMRAEAVGEGQLGMLMVGNVAINRVLADCLTFKNVKTLYDAIYQNNQFSEKLKGKKEVIILIEQRTKNVHGDRFFMPVTSLLLLSILECKKV